MSTLCSSGCLTADLIGYRDECDEIRVEKGGLGYLLFAKCGVAIDFTDETEIAAAITAGDLVVTPAGIGSIPLPTTTKAKYKCGPEEVTKRMIEVSFKCYDVDNADAVELWNTLITKQNALRVGWITCSGKLVYDTTAATTENPLFVYGIDGGKVTPENDMTENQYFEVKVQVELDKNTAILPEVQLTSLLRTAFLS
jgi:hypothetical protein